MKITKKIKHYLTRIRRVSQLEKENSKIVVKPLDELNRVPLFFDSSNRPKVSIIIPFYNEEIYTWNCLLFLNKYLTNEIPFEILLFDDNSTEKNDFSLIKGISIHRNNENLGFLKNINKGIQLAKGEYIYILNNDTEVQENFLKELFYVFENFKNVGAVGSKLINPNWSLQEAGSVFMKDFNIRQIVTNKKTFYPEVNYIVKVDYCSGCSLLFKKLDDNGNLNLFDEQFAPAYFEETDFCFNLKYIQKKEIYYTPFSEVVHYNGTTYNSLKNKVLGQNEKKDALFKTNSEKFKTKWSKQLQEIKETTIEGRIQEIYENKSIVFFNGIIPEYDKDSGSNRLKEIITSYIELDYHVTLICKFVYKDNNYISAYEKLGVNVFYEHKKFTGFEKYLLDQKIKASIAWFHSPMEFIDFYKVAKKIFPMAKFVYDMVDIHHLRYKRAIELEPTKISFRKKYIRYKNLEYKSSKLADYVITISKFEEDYMKSVCDENKIITISNIHYPKINSDKTLPFEERKDVLFIGSAHTPNVDALYYLYNEIMPLVWNKIPDLNVNIIGSVDNEIKDIDHPNFIFWGYVENIDNFFISNKFMIAPLRYGAGVKGKIGQAFEYYLPVVTSSIGAEGMHLTNNENALIEDSKEGFANAIINLYDNKELWKKLQDNSEKSLLPFSRKILKDTLLTIK
ncbi:glycosyltransferase [Flavobacterium taihuense]|uniref:Glycosyltransferase n=1 Tax=Flavobacterium taihuense TaxID=2857508 RepID=A0ABS6XVT1_9FLAO|nr:glycosyltransferase [Flavobacterium taihuense]MBW4360785.1 glycosyltransferase [Flavobacterium taihuense]